MSSTDLCMQHWLWRLVVSERLSLAFGVGSAFALAAVRTSSFLVSDRSHWRSHFAAGVYCQRFAPFQGLGLQVELAYRHILARSTKKRSSRTAV